MGMGLTMLGFFSGFWGVVLPGWALPGQPAVVVTEWLQAHPVLDAEPGETLLINRFQPDGSRFSFQASVAPPGRIINPLDNETIRSERMTFFNPSGLTAQTLEQAIQDIYGEAIAVDLEQATEVLRYPAAAVLNEPITETNALARAIQGVVRQGEQFVYWLELTQNPDGSVQQGQAVVFEAEWLDKVKTELSQRYNVESLDTSVFP